MDSDNDDDSSDDETLFGKTHKTINESEFKERQAYLRANPGSQGINKANVQMNKATRHGQSFYNYLFPAKRSGGKRRRSRQSNKLRETGKSSRGKRSRRGRRRGRGMRGGATRKLNPHH